MDEADRMLDLGFAAQLNMINSAADHRKRQSMMFSATLDSAEMHKLTQTLLNNPQRISVGASNEEHKDIQQQFYFADNITHKETLLSHAIQQQDYRQIIVFTATRADTERLATLLKEQDFDAIGLSGDLTQGQRNNIMNEFSRGQQHILVTTDIASRGLDLANVALVINFDLPKQADEYVHRVGRTGRAGNKGQALSFVGPKDWYSFLAIKGFLQQEIKFSEFSGLAAKFKGLRPAKKKVKPQHKDKPKAKKVVDQTSPAASNRVNTMQGKEVGDIPMKRKPKRPAPDTSD